MSQAVGIAAPGGLEQLCIVERQVRDPGPSEVRIHVRAAAVNPTDIGLRQMGATDLQAPWVPGMDAAGTIESVGEGVDRLSVGEEVMAAVSPRRAEGGAQQELLLAPAASVVPIPGGASLEQAATLPMNGLTAMLGLDMLGLQAGETLLVTGGAGLLASYVIPLAKERGLTVIADAKPEDEELVRSFGADTVVPRDGEPAGGAIVDGVYDTALLHDATFPALRDGGGIAVIRGWDPDETPRGITVHRVMVRDVLERTDWLEHLRELATHGTLQLRVAAEFPPGEAKEAQRLMEAGGLRGRAVVVF
jgi:NADPH:quinone reductase-like Zn-dependent oxidoreductase